MKILLSPSKTQDFSNFLFQDKKKKIKKLKYQSISEKIYDDLKKLNISDIVKVYSISEKLAMEVEYMIKNYHTNKELEAIIAYTGSVYREIRVHTYQEDEIKFLQEHVRILSAFYGVLEPLNLIKAYRLDMKTKLETLDLKKIWSEIYTNEFKDEDIVINLASKEFSSLIKRDLTNIEFKDYNGEKFIVKATYAKIARGKMVNYIVKSKIRDIDGIKAIIVDNYKYNESISTDNNLVFTR